MKTALRLDRYNRIVLSRDLRGAAGIATGQKLKVSAAPGRIVLETETNSGGKIVRRGKLKVWTGAVPNTPLEEAVAYRSVLDERWRLYRKGRITRLSLENLERRLQAK